MPAAATFATTALAAAFALATAFVAAAVATAFAATSAAGLTAQVVDAVLGGGRPGGGGRISLQRGGRDDAA